MQQEISLQGANPTPAPESFSLLLTERAVTKARALIARDPRPGVALRVAVEGGGCSGLSYNLTLDDSQRDDDLRLDQDGVPIVVDASSARYLTGISIDYVDALTGAGFKFDNPNAERTCGCGTSFNV